MLNKSKLKVLRYIYTSLKILLCFHLNFKGYFLKYTGFLYSLNAEFQRIVRRNKKDFLSDQRKEIEGNNRIRKTRDLFKKIRDTKGIFHSKMLSIKDGNGMDLTEAEDI